MRRILFLSDAHLPGEPDLTGRFLAMLDGIGPETQALVLLGDLFDLWVAFPSLEEEHHRRVLEGLRAVRARGVRLLYVEGNRDYGVCRHRGSLFDEVTDRSLSIPFGGRRVLVAHGDLVNTADAPYRAWRLLTRNPLTLAAFRLLPRRAASRLARTAERRLRRTNRSMKSRFPEEACASFCTRASARGADLVVLGHFHEGRRLAFPGLPAGFELRVLPAWFQDPRPLALLEDGSLASPLLGPP